MTKLEERHRLGLRVGVWGERAPKAKLTLADVEEIRRWAAEGIPFVQIAGRKGVCESTIGDIVYYRHWRRMLDDAATRADRESNYGWLS